MPLARRLKGTGLACAARPPRSPRAGSSVDDRDQKESQVAAWHWMLRHASVEYLDAEEESLNCHVAESDR